MVKEGDVIFGNVYFDMIKGYIEFCKVKVIDCIIVEVFDIVLEYLFKGNIDLEKLEVIIL